MNFTKDILWRKKILRKIDANYHKHPNFEEVINVIELLIMNEESNIVEFNIKSISTIMECLDLDIKKLKKSSDFKISGNPNVRNGELTKIVGGDIYLSGDGAESYQDESILSEMGIRIEYQKFMSPVYSQSGQNKFIPGLSIVDAAMNLGWKNTRKLVLMDNN